MDQQNSKPINSTSETDEAIATTVKVPLSMWRRVRNLSTDRRASQQAIWLKAMEEYIDRQEEKAEGSAA